MAIRAAEPVYTFDVIEKDSEGRVRFHYVIVDLAAEYVSGTPRPGSDAVDARWVSAAGLRRLRVSAKTMRLLADRFDFGG